MIEKNGISKELYLLYIGIIFIVEFYQGGDRMSKVRRIIVIVFSVVYLILILGKVEIPKEIYTLLIVTILANQAFDEWNRYKETKKKLNLLIPILSVVIILFVVLKLMKII